MIFCTGKFSFSQSTPAIITDWMDFAGVSDTLTVIPVVKDDSSNVISVGVNVDSITGADILITKLDSSGSLEWQHTYSSAGFNRDHAIAVAVDEKCGIYVAGVVYSSATNFDWIILKYAFDGTLAWTYTLNGTANNYDAPAAIKVKNSFVYVTGEVFDSVSQLNYATIQLNRITGVLNWKRDFDFNSLYDIAFAMDISGAGNGVTVAGAIQSSLTSWKYCSISYDSAGVANDTTSIDGTANSFDRPMAIKSDVFGNFYITGAASDSGASFNVRTAKVDSAGNLAWVADFGISAKDDEGNDIIVDDSGYVYVCGKSHSYTSNHLGLLLLKYSNNGTEQYYRIFEADRADDEAHKMCFDNYGNIVMTGTTIHSNKDILTLAYDRAGNFLWKIYFNGDFDGDDEGTGITADANGNIFVAGVSQITDSTYQIVTVKYKTDYFLVPQDTVPAPSSLLFYPNAGQIIDTQDSIRRDISFYTINQFPKLYFHQDSISFVMAHVDSDTATADTLERITMNFADGNMAHGGPYTANTHDTDQVLNYFLGHCPDGITGITGSEKIMYREVYDKTNVIFSNNNAGMKFQIIMDPGFEPQALLHFTGHQSLQLVNNSDLQVSGVLGSFTYQRPLVYQLDEYGGRISLGWLASYYIGGDNVSFILPGSYDHDKPVVLEIARPDLQQLTCDDNLCWSTYFGDIGHEQAKATTTTPDGDIIVTGFTTSSVLPYITGQSYSSPVSDVWIIKIDGSSNNITWGMFYGGSHLDEGWDVDCDSSGNIYCAGITYSPELPQYIDSSLSTIPGGDSLKGGNDIFILKLKPDASDLVWANYVGSSGNEYGSVALSVDKGGDQSVYLVSTTGGGDLLTYAASDSNAYYQPQNNGSGSGRDGFIMQLSDSGALKWSTYFGGNNSDDLRGIDLVPATSNSPFHLYIYGQTYTDYYDNVNPGNAPPDSGGFPFSNIGTGDYYYWGGGSTDGFICEFNDHHELVWSTFIGGVNINSVLERGLAGSDSVVYFAFYSIDNINGFPSQPFCPACFSQPFQGGQASGYLCKFSNRQLVWSTCIGGSNSTGIRALHYAQDKLFVCGYTTSRLYSTSADYCTDTPNTATFPLCAPNNYYFNTGLNPNNPNPYADAFLMAFNRNNQMLWSTPLGGSSQDAAYDLTTTDSSLFLVGFTSSSHYAIWEDYPQIFLPSAYNQGNNGGDSSGTYDVFISRFVLQGGLIGVEENELPDLKIICYPNPLSNEVSFTFDNPSHNKYIVSVFDLTGRIALEENSKTSSGKMSLNLAALAPGMYFVQISNKEFNSTAKIIKQ